MTGKFYKAVRFIARGILWLCAVFLIGGILLQLSLWGGLAWLNATKGQDWIQVQIDDSLSGSGYSVTFDSLSINLAQGLVATNLKVGDHEGVFFETDRMGLRPALLAMPAHILSVSAKSDTAILHRLPAESPDSTDEAPQPFALPDLYFKTFHLDALTVDTLDIRPSVAGVPLLLSTRIESHMALTDMIDGDVSITLDNTDDRELPPWLPETIRLSGAFDTQTLVLTLEDMRATAPLYDLSAKGSADFTAEGPLDLSFNAQIHDMESLSETLTGTAFAIGTITGTLDAPVIQASGKAMLDRLKERGIGDITWTLDAQDLMDTPDGHIAVDTVYDQKPVHLGADFSYEAPSLTLGEMTGTAPSLTLTGGMVIDTETGLMAGDLSAKSPDLAPYADMAGFALSGAGTFDVRLHAADEKQAADLKARFTTLRYDTVSAARVDLSTTLADINNPWPDALDLKAGDLRGSDTLHLQTLNATLAEKGRDHYALSLAGKSMTPQPISFKGAADITGAPDAPTIDADMTLTPLRIGQSGPEVQLSLTGTYADEQARVTLTGTGEGIRKLTGEASAPLTFSLQPFAFEMDAQMPVTGSATLDLDMITLSRSFLPPGHSVTGDFTGNATLSGTIGNPDYAGRFAFKDGSYFYTAYGVGLKDITAAGTLDSAQLTLTTLSATDGEAGRLSGNGTVGLSANGKTDIAITADTLHLLQGEMANGTLSADITVSGQDNEYALSGTVTSQQIDIVIPEQFQSNIPALNIISDAPEPSDAGKNVTLDITVQADNRIFVRGWGLDAEFGGKITIDGDLSDPQYTGSFSSLRGRYEEFGKRFTIDKAALRFQGSVPPSPYLDIEATTQAEDITATVHLTGPVASPALALSSVPGLPKDEILARILFGRDMDRITSFQAVQLAQTLRRFSGKGGGMGFDPLGKLRALTGLDDITVDTNDDGETSVGAGKYLTEDVYLTLEKGQSESSGAAGLEVELTPNITLESEVGQDAQAGAGVSWRWDY